MKFKKNLLSFVKYNTKSIKIKIKKKIDRRAEMVSDKKIFMGISHRVLC
jgi:hypothetical protein